MISLHRQHVDRFLASAIPADDGLRGLHIGCGAGDRGRYRPSPRQHWTAVDLAHGPLRADILALPFRTASFDIVRATEMLYFLGVREITGALSECRRVLKHGGRFVATVPLLVPPISAADQVRITPEGWRAIMPFWDPRITPLGGYWTHLVTTLEHLSRGFVVLRPLARFDDPAAYPHALGLTGVR